MTTSWIALISIGMSFLVLVIGASELERITEAMKHEEVKSQVPQLPSFEAAILGPLLVGIVGGGVLSFIVPCNWAEMFNAYRWVILAGVVASTISGAVMFLMLRKREFRYWVWGSALAGIAMVVLGISSGMLRHCEKGTRPEPQNPSVQKVKPETIGKQIGRDVVRWLGSGFVLADASIDTASRAVGLPLLDGGPRDLRGLAERAQAEASPIGAFITAAWAFMLSLFVFGVARWMARARWKGNFGAIILTVTLASVYPLCLGLLAIAIGAYVWPGAPLAFWIGGSLAGLMAAIAVAIWAVRSASTSRAATAAA